MSSRRRYSLDVWARRSADGLLISGGAPSRLLRLSPLGGDVLTTALEGAASADPAAQRFLTKLVDAGLLHPSGVPEEAIRAPLTTIVPVRDGAQWLGPLVGSLRIRGEVLVVDDGSTDGSVEIAMTAGARVLFNQQAAGQSGARNTGLLAATSDLVAFVDQDCVVTPRWADHLVGLFDDSSLAVAAPRVRSVFGSSALARYEFDCSPLDLGPDPSLVEPGRRISYVPSAAFVARRAALLEVGGFDPELRVGEDVDLVWRLLEAGWKVRYAPSSEVGHHPRATLRAMALQRYRYGESAPMLQLRHPGAATPLHAAPETIAIWFGGATLGPAAAIGGLAAATLAAAGRGRHPRDRCEIATLVAKGQLRATRYLARVLVREWLPITTFACIWSRRGRRVMLGAYAVDALTSRGGQRHRAGLAAHLALHALDVVAYSAGLWRGVVRERSVDALKIRLTRSAAASAARRAGSASRA